LRCLDVLVQALQHDRYAHRFFFGMPHIVVCHQCEQPETEFCLPSQTNLRHRRHTDDVQSPRTVQVRFCARRELWAFDADISPSVVDAHAGRDRCLGECPPQFRAKRLIQRDMDNRAALIEKRARPPDSSVDDLIGYDEIEWCDLLAETADSTHGDDPLHSERLECPKIGPGWYIARTVLVRTTVSRYESDAHPMECSQRDGIARSTEGGLDGDLLHIGELRHAIETASTDHTEFSVHQLSFPRSVGPTAHVTLRWEAVRSMHVQDNIELRPATIGGQWGPFWWATFRVLLVLLVLTWWATVLARLTRLSPDTTRTPSVLAAGLTYLPDSRVQLEGDWVVQQLGDGRLVATRTAGDRLRFQFAGTAAAVEVRAGPDAGAILVSIENAHASLRSVNRFSLLRSSARLEMVPIVNNLVPGIYRVEVTNEDGGELAIRAIVIENSPGVWWAWLPPVVVGITFLAHLLITWWNTLLEALGWFRVRPEKSEKNAST
jgi:hypothetical protein